MHKALSIFLGFIISLFSFPALAISHPFIAHSGAQYYTFKDWQLFVANQKYTLTNSPDGVKVPWTNPQTNHGGYFIPLDTTMKNGNVCRKLIIYAAAEGAKGKGTFSYCYINRMWTQIKNARQ